MINIYFYNVNRPRPRNVLDSWPDCVAAPRKGEVVALGEGDKTENWVVDRVAWSKPAGDKGPQVVDILVSIDYGYPEARGVQIGYGNVQNNTLR